VCSFFQMLFRFFVELFGGYIVLCIIVSFAVSTSAFYCMEKLTRNDLLYAVLCIKFYLLTCFTMS